jgi:ParB family chromosome partitioning protein
MGERRLRASGLAGLTEIPAVIRDTEDTDLLRDALLENLHRAQLNPLEEAAAYQQLLDDFSCTHDELASRIARSRPQITNTLRLLRLPALVQRRVAAGVLSAGHARALLGLEDGAAMERLAQRIVAEGLSVRATEEAVAMGEGAQRPELRRRRAPSAHSEQLDRLATRLSDRLDTRVKVTMGQRKGRITVDFASVDDLDRILGSLAPGESVQSD